MQRFLCEQCRSRKGLKRYGHWGTKGTDIHAVSDICSPSVQIGKQSFVFLATWYPSLAIQVLAEFFYGHPNKQSGGGGL